MAVEVGYKDIQWLDAINMSMRVNEITLSQYEAEDRARRSRLNDLLARTKAFQQEREQRAEVHEGMPQRPEPPKSPEQQRVASLQQTAKKAQQAVRAERGRQRIAKQVEKMNQSRAVIAKARQAIATQ